LSQEKLSTNRKKPPLAARKIEQAESGQATLTRTPFFTVDGACERSTRGVRLTGSKSMAIVCSTPRLSMTVSLRLWLSAKPIARRV
jgi:hypothetical protein